MRKSAASEFCICSDPNMALGVTICYTCRKEVEMAPRSRSGVALISTERARQIDLGWSIAHDRDHDGRELIQAAQCYIDVDYAPGDPTPNWPWDPESFHAKQADPVRNLVKAGALIAAEIDRLNGGGG